MMDFPVYASHFQLFPPEGKAYNHLQNLLTSLERIDFTLQVKDPSKNSGQMISDFDLQLQKVLLSHGAVNFNLPLPPDIRQELDFTITYQGSSVAVEIEKTNKEKILRDILKCHMYLYYAADYSLVVLPTNYPHKHGIWDLFRFGSEAFTQCKQYGFGTSDKLERIILLGYTQFDASTQKSLDTDIRQQMRETAKKTYG